MKRRKVLRVLVTVGPTQEPIDAVRFLSNRSSGRMGYAVAETAREAGCRVTLATGPVCLTPPDGVRVLRFETTQDLARLLEREAPRSDLVFMLAAVADWRPARAARGKRPRAGGRWALPLAPTPDLLARLGARRDRPFVVGFSLEERWNRARALRKMDVKRCDLMVLNTLRSMGADRTRLELLERMGHIASRAGSKSSCARWLVREVLRRYRGKGQQPRGELS
ncbi:MAG: phosphopantothenoylcysteine decarboxylase [Planctomycetes bacterium]|nr:phosphopantothenoylcysteine decarboxylase [Planctomycetota bacterium]